MQRLESLKKSDHFRLVLKGRKLHTDFFSIYAKKIFTKSKKKDSLNIRLVMKKKLGTSVKRNRIKRKLKAIVINLAKIKGAINHDYTYIVFGKSKAYEENNKNLHQVMIKSFKKLNYRNV